VCLGGATTKELAMNRMALPMRRSQWIPRAGLVLRWTLQAALCAAVAFSALPGAAPARTPAGEDATDAASQARPRANAAPGAPSTVPNRLKVGTLVAFDLRRGNVGDAIDFVLEPVRYRVTHRTVDPRVSAEVLRRPIPPVAANAGVMSIEAALLLLIGEEHRLVVDHAHRLVAIERMPQQPAGAP
jgi:hypothetical protein